MGPGPDKIVQDTLKARIEELMTDDAAFAGYLYGCSLEEIERCMAHFRENKPTVKLSFARTSDKWPVWAIILGSKRPYQEFIGRSGGAETDEDSGIQYQRYTSVVSPGISIWVYTENADVTRWHSDLIEGILNTAQPELLAAFEEVAFGGAQDLSPEQAYAPENLWVRAQTWDFTVSQTFLRRMDDMFEAGGSGTTLLTPPAYVGVDGEDLGDGVRGGVVPYSERG